MKRAGIADLYPICLKASYQYFSGILSLFSHKDSFTHLEENLVENRRYAS